MSQTSKIFGALFVGFIVYVTAKGQLGSYLSLFGIGSATSTTGATT